MDVVLCCVTTLNLKVGLRMRVMCYGISTTMLLLLLLLRMMAMTYKYDELMSFALSPVNVWRRRLERSLQS